MALIDSTKDFLVQVVDKSDRKIIQYTQGEEMSIQNVYDNEQFFKDYIDMRNHEVNANNLIEIPTIKKMIPDLKGKTVLDLGCGTGEMCRYFVSLGAKRVVGIDISQNMLNLAKQENCEKIEYRCIPMEEIISLNEKFDMVFSSLAFHYVEDFEKLMQDISNLLKKDGTLLYSQEHPVATATDLHKQMENRIDIDGKRYFLLSDYNKIGIRKFHWNIDGVIKYHRNFTIIVNSLIQAKLNILEIQESQALAEAVKQQPKYKYQEDRPYFLFVKATKQLQS